MASIDNMIRVKNLPFFLAHLTGVAVTSEYKILSKVNSNNGLMPYLVISRLICRFWGAKVEMQTKAAIQQKERNYLDSFCEIC